MTQIRSHLMFVPSVEILSHNYYEFSISFTWNLCLFFFFNCHFKKMLIFAHIKCSSNFKNFYFAWSEKSDNSIKGIQGIQWKFLTVTFRGYWSPTLLSISSNAYIFLRIQTSKLLYILEWKCKYSKWSWDLLMKEMINTKLSFIFCMKKHYRTVSFSVQIRIVTLYWLEQPLGYTVKTWEHGRR